MDDAPSPRDVRASRAWRDARTARDAWARFRAWLSKRKSEFNDADAPHWDTALHPHHQYTGPKARALILFQKTDAMNRFLPDGRGSDWATRLRIATAVVPFAPRAFDVDLIRAHARLLGGVPIGFVGDLDPHGLHVFGALRSGDLDTPDVHGRRLRVEWLGLDDAWLHQARKRSGTLSAHSIRMGWVEKEYWGIMKRFAPDVREMIGGEAFGLLESGVKFEIDGFVDVMAQRIRAALPRLAGARARGSSTLRD
jgi:hypothetical protein